jgi:hypothetical protein
VLIWLKSLKIAQDAVRCGARDVDHLWVGLWVEDFDVRLRNPAKSDSTVKVKER